MERGTIMEINYKDIGIRVKQERINKNITQEKLAEISGVSVTHMSNIECKHQTEFTCAYKYC